MIAARSFSLIPRYFKKDPNTGLFSLFIGLAVIVSILFMFSLLPQIGDKFGKVSEKKEEQVTHAASAPCAQYGDVDGNGSVTSTDATLISRNVAGLSTTVSFTDAAVKKRADVDGNLKIEAVDQLLVLRFISGFAFTFPVCVDHDSDGFTDAVENYIGTDPYKACGIGAWPPDFNNDKTVNTTDSLYYQGKIPTTVASAADRRLDLESDGTLTTADSQKLNPYMLTQCTTSLPPLMTFLAGKSNVVVGDSITTSWAVARAVVPCDASSTGSVSWTGQKKLSGFETIKVSSPGTSTLTLTCYGPGGKTSMSGNVTAIVSCSGTPILGLNGSESNIAVDVGAQVTVNVRGLSNCTSADTAYTSTNSTPGSTWKADGQWLTSCTLSNGSTCSATVTLPSSFTPGGPYSARVRLDRGTNGSIDTTSSNIVTINVNAPPQPQPQPQPDLKPHNWPAIGYIGELGVHYTGYGSYAWWEAIDVIGSYGSAVYATLNGNVEVLAYDSAGCGYGLNIKNSEYTVHYCHIRSGGIRVTSGQNVVVGQLIGEMGTSGNASGNQVHYSVSSPAGMKPPYVPDDVCRYCNIDNLTDSNITY